MVPYIWGHIYGTMSSILIILIISIRAPGVISYIIYTASLGSPNLDFGAKVFKNVDIVKEKQRDLMRLPGRSWLPFLIKSIKM